MENRGANFSHRAASCLRGLEECCSQHNDRFVKQQLDRFSLWINITGAFADHHASLDCRLREAHHLADALRDRLDILHVQICRVLDSNGPNPLSISQLPDSSIIPSEASSAAELALTNATKENLCAIDDTISWLFTFALVIRKGGTRGPFQRAAKFKIEDKDGNDITDQFESYVRRVMEVRMRCLGPNLRERLITSVCVRRRWFSYARSRQRELARSAQVSPLLSRSDTQREGVSVSAPSVSQIRPSASVPVPSAKRTGSLNSTTTVSHLPADDSIPETPGKSAPSEAPSAASTWLGLSGNVEVPPPPKLPPGYEEYPCPYCNVVLPAERYANQIKWQHHVIHDLRPYICVYEDCPFPVEVFSTTKDWHQHLRKPHKIEWVCPVKATSTHGSSKDKGILKNDVAAAEHTWIFRSHKDFEKHMTNSHDDIYTPSQISVLAKRSTRPAESLLDCPFCESPRISIAEDHHRFEHIGRHLISVALMSLP